MKTRANELGLATNQGLQNTKPAIPPNISTPFPLSGTAKSALILKALRAGIEAASGDLQMLYQEAGRHDAGDIKQLTSVIHALIKEFTDSLAGTVVQKPTVTSQREGPYGPRRPDQSQPKYTPSPAAFARNLQHEHSGVVAIALDGKNTKFTAQVLRLLDTDKAQRAILHFANTEDIHEVSHEKAAKIIRLKFL